MDVFFYLIGVLVIYFVEINTRISLFEYFHHLYSL